VISIFRRNKRLYDVIVKIQAIVKGKYYRRIFNLNNARKNSFTMDSASFPNKNKIVTNKNN